MIGPLVFRLAIPLAVVAAVGSTAALRQPLFGVFLLLETAISLVEGWFARLTSPQPGGHADRDQLPFVLAGKQYLLAQLTYKAIVLAAFAWTARSVPRAFEAVSIAGAVLMMLGVVLRLWAMARLRERFRGFEVRREERGLETGGPYALMRHPGYVALALFDIGIPLLLGVPAFVALVVVPLAIMRRRIRLEEELLMRAYPEYAEYAARERL